MNEWYQIENNNFIVQVNSKGAEVKRLFAKPWHRELLWVPADEAAKKIWNRTSPVLFPIVGKLKEDHYQLKGKTFQMSQHGFARDRDFTCFECGDSEVTFKLEADQESFKQYPFCFELRVTYQLVENQLNITYTVKNDDRQDIYFSIGAHPAFVTDLADGYEVQFEKQEAGYFKLARGLVNWKDMHQLSSEKIIPTKELFAGDALIFKNMKSKFVDLVNTKRHETIRLHGSKTPYFGIWAKDSVPFICLEPWYGVSDDEGHDQNLENKKGIQKLVMGDTFQFSYSIEIL